MEEVERSCEEMSKCNEKNKMSTSESEQSLSDKTSCPPNRAVIFMKHCSDYSDENDADDGNGNDDEGCGHDDGDGERDELVMAVVTATAMAMMR